MHLWIISISFAITALGANTGLANAQSFGGYPCTVDCSGHEAGYEWAQQKGITDAYSCGGKSQSFIEGCMAFAEEAEDDPYGSSSGFGFEESEDEAEDEGAIW